MQAYKLDILKKTQGQKNSKLKEKTQELKKKTQGFSNICRIEKRNTTFFHKNVIFNAYFLPDITKSEWFCVKIKLFMFKMVIFWQRLFTNFKKKLKTQEKNSRFRQNQKLELPGIGPICKPAVDMQMDSKIKGLW